jgi:hypothetical protein
MPATEMSTFTGPKALLTGPLTALTNQPFLLSQD